MITTLTDGKKVLLAKTAIVSITEAGTSSQWHGTKSFIKLINGETISCDESIENLLEKISNDQ